MGMRRDFEKLKYRGKVREAAWDNPRSALGRGLRGTTYGPAGPSRQLTGEELAKRKQELERRK